VKPALTNSPLGYPLEPGYEAATMKAAPEERRSVARTLRPADSISNAPGIDRAHQICRGMQQPAASAHAARRHASIRLAVRACAVQARPPPNGLAACRQPDTQGHHLRNGTGAICACRETRLNARCDNAAGNLR
jgi:hypothetical protein